MAFTRTTGQYKQRFRNATDKTLTDGEVRAWVCRPGQSENGRLVRARIFAREQAEGRPREDVVITRRQKLRLAQFFHFSKDGRLLAERIARVLERRARLLAGWLAS